MLAAYTEKRNRIRLYVSMYVRVHLRAKETYITRGTPNKLRCARRRRYMNDIKDTRLLLLCQA